jgi:hypothetical protein
MANSDTDGFNLFGFTIKKKAKEENDIAISFVPPEDDSGTTVEASGGHYGYQVDFDQTNVKSDKELVAKYRDAAQTIECDSAIEDIVNEAIVSDATSAPVNIVTDDLKGNTRLKKVLAEEFDNVVNMLNFNERAHDIFRRWYIDGRLYFHVIIDEAKPKEGIQELRHIDASRMRKVRKVEKTRNEESGTEMVSGVEEYFIYQDSSLQHMEAGLKINVDSIVYVTSGVLDPSRKFVQSYLHKALRAVNQLRMMEDSLVVYRWARAPERRIFYIDVGNLPRGKAEEYVAKIMAKHRNKLVYDATTGEMKDERKQMNMLEDFWLPRREGGRGTEIDTLPGGDNLGQIDDVTYFKEKLYASLNVPQSRMEKDTPFSMGRAQEISRDEVKFQKFISRLRRKFSHLFFDLLRKQLLLKGLINEDEWDEIRSDITIDYVKDSHYKEIQEAELLRDRLTNLRDIDSYVGKYYSSEWIRKNVLMQTDEDIALIDKQIAGSPEDEEDYDFTRAQKFQLDPMTGQPPQSDEPVDAAPATPKPKDKEDDADEDADEDDKKREKKKVKGDNGSEESAAKKEELELLKSVSNYLNS